MFNKKWTIESDDDIFNAPEKKSGFGGLFAKKSPPGTEKEIEIPNEKETEFEDVKTNNDVEKPIEDGSTEEEEVSVEEVASGEELPPESSPLAEEFNISLQEPTEQPEDVAEANAEPIMEPAHKRRVEVLNTPDDVTEKPIKKGFFKRFRKEKEQEPIEDANDSVVYIPERPKKKRKKKKAEEEITPKEVDRTQYLDAMEWFEMLSLTSIPVIGFIILIFMSFWPVKSGKGIDRRGYARGKLLQSIFIYGILIGMLYFGYLKLYPYAMDFLDKLEAL